MNITFDDNLITGNKTIDFQHQELIDRIRQFVAACESGDSKIKAIKMLDYLIVSDFIRAAREELGVLSAVRRTGAGAACSKCSHKQRA